MRECTTDPEASYKDGLTAYLRRYPRGKPLPTSDPMAVVEINQRWAYLQGMAHGLGRDFRADVETFARKVTRCGVKGCDQRGTERVDMPESWYLMCRQHADAYAAGTLS